MNLKIKVKNSVVLLGGEQADPLRRDLAAFDIANATPLDCRDFIVELMRRYGDTGKR